MMRKLRPIGARTDLPHALAAKITCHGCGLELVGNPIGAGGQSEMIPEEIFDQKPEDLKFKISGGAGAVWITADEEFAYKFFEEDTTLNENNEIEIPREIQVSQLLRDIPGIVKAVSYGLLLQKIPHTYSKKDTDNHKGSKRTYYTGIEMIQRVAKKNRIVKDNGDLLLKKKEGLWVKVRLVWFIKMQNFTDDLFELLYDKKVDLSMQDNISIIEQIMTQLEAIHKAGYAHNDISATNILYRKDSAGKFIVAISDFETLEKDKTAAALKHQKFHRPPGMENLQVSSVIFDWFAFSVVAMFVFLRAFPFEDSQQHIYFKSLLSSYKEEIENESVFAFLHYCFYNYRAMDTAKLRELLGNIKTKK
jgi:serine/threonine protein kinase